MLRHDNALLPCALALLALAAPLSAPVAAQDQDLISGEPDAGTIWFQSLPPKVSSGSALLGSVDLGPLTPPSTIAGPQASWLAWTPKNAYLHRLGGATPLSTAEVFLDPPVNSQPFVDCQGAASLDGGWVRTVDSGTGGLTDLDPHQGALLWTPDRLFVLRQDGGPTLSELFDPLGFSITEILGLTVITSGTFDLDPSATVVDPHTIASALVWSPFKVYRVELDIGPSTIQTATQELLDPFVVSIHKTRGATVVQSGWDLTGPAPTPRGAALLWNGEHVFAIELVPGGHLLTEVIGNGSPLEACWGVMGACGPLVGSEPYHYSALVWQEHHAWLAARDGALTVNEVTVPPGGPANPALVSEVRLNPNPYTFFVERQASSLYEMLAKWRDSASGKSRRGYVMGTNQRHR